MRSCSPSSPDLVRRARPWLGTVVEVCADRSAAIAPAFAAISRVHRLMSFQDPASELAALNRARPGDWADCSPATVAVLERARFWAEESGGAFEPQLAAKRPLCEALELAPGRARRLTAAPIDLSGIAKGYAVDLAVEALHLAGASTGLVNAGGDLRGFGPEAWPVVIVEPATRRPSVEVEVKEAALATSAGRPAEGGLDFTHLPRRTGAWRSVSVTAPAAVDADALTKIVLAGGATACACLARVGAEALGLGREGWRLIAPLGDAE